ncbi:MAG: ABC transporter permease [Sphaerochaetaceae bacterium]|nr:ABC transporter permease [Sphaerochaetaceae bacterium]
MSRENIANKMLDEEISRSILLRRRGRLEQVFIYLGKFLRLFVYQNEWKVFPLAAVVAAIVSMVVKRDFFMTMEGTLKGAFALTCISIWNGCFNSIQSVCREREIVKREHRSGLHISSYIVAHMLYQAILCIGQTVLTLYVFRIAGIKMPEKGLVTSYFFLELGVTIFLTTYAADLLSLWISTIAHTSTTAMTVMPFVLILQLVFSGGIFTLPAWTEPIGRLSISGYSTKCFMAQADYNNKPLVTIWNTIQKLEDNEITTSFTLNDIFEKLQNDSSGQMAALRKEVVFTPKTVGELYGAIKETESFKAFQKQNIDLSFSVGEVLGELKNSDELKDFRNQDLAFISVDSILSLLSEYADQFKVSQLRFGKNLTVSELMNMIRLDDIIALHSDVVVGETVTVGDIIDYIISNEDIQAVKNDEIKLSIRVGDVIDILGRDRLINYLESSAAEASYNPMYEHTVENIWGYWLMLLALCASYGTLAIITLEFIDKDKR